MFNISYLELWRPFVWRSGTICAILVEGIMRNYSVLKIFLIWSSGGPFVQRSGTICAIMVEGIMRNNSVKLF